MMKTNPMNRIVVPSLFVLSAALLFNLFTLSGSAQAQEAEMEKKWNITTNPFSYFTGRFNVGASYALTKNIALSASPALVYLFQSSPKISGASLSLGLPIYFDRVYDGLYVEPGLQGTYLRQKVTENGETATGISAGPQFLLGHMWQWPSGFNIDLGLGLGYSFSSVDLRGTGSSYYDGVVPAGKLQFGYLF